MTKYSRAIRAKGWSGRTLAKRWGKTPRTISRICQRPSQRDWDALEGLPDIRPQDALLARPYGQVSPDP